MTFFDCTADLVGQLNGNGQKGVLQIHAPHVDNFWLHHCIEPWSFTTAVVSDKAPACLINFSRLLKVNMLTRIHIGTNRMSQYQKGKTNLDFTEARNSEWQWHQVGHMQVCTSLQTDNHARTPPISFLQDRCPSFHQTNSIKAHT